MKNFVKLPFYLDGKYGIDLNEIADSYFNRNAIINFDEQLNQLNGKKETMFYMADGSTYYCPLTIDELIEKLS